jgi:hypothetical protein
MVLLLYTEIAHFTLYQMCWVLAKVHRVQARPRVADRGGRGSILDVGLSGYYTESLTVYHSGQCVWRVPRSRHAKDLFCRFRKTVDAL